ncbi:MULTISPECIES: TIGR01459 family HAD-type hydrolase [Okeania]|uniref:TIGR01459 family HAD-type hydrolase n=1 Tax=Okeania hirsuta TaxID=1458930 RepID=A0A3N6P7A1_9CYAN|nr:MULTISPECIES: TIGR01459 family HAD-type hydrolase [Okeania]NET12933.1 TIGR01459 family HAD-type hydrolase [Okeania sp. SIO1H6]NES79670.1 TIGR01459 family HAD-type hydrolase [Okeania sp. SIO1H4]NES89294.1 TIGR01459 family HAD-type hydrolase [Okeania sp. SIO2B9]NET23327.1 TIGR01459 family HAD-type hydrolase [Okeania sp. SIO1H5]NET97014.1 TIGR01459 family HAD-type hydrolase [Okeania sp. SIO1H2]
MRVNSFIDSWHELAERFDVFFIDLWGVLIDGERCFPYAIEWLTFLKNQGKTVVLISNTPTIGASMSEQLLSLGISQTLYQAIVTSGDTTRYLLSADTAANKTIVGSHYYYMGEAQHEQLLQGLPYSRVNQPQEAEFILLTATDSAFESPQDFQVFLEIKVTMLCVNPDLHTLSLLGEKRFCAGSVAQMYQQLGGTVIYIGKPFPDIFALAHSHVNFVDKAGIVMVGDTLYTDIKGGLDYGFKTALVNKKLSSQDIKPDYVFMQFTQ